MPARVFRVLLKLPPAAVYGTSVNVEYTTEAADCNDALERACTAFPSYAYVESVTEVVRASSP